MPVLVTSKCDEEPIKNEQASLETPFCHYKSGNKHSRAPNSVGWSDLGEIRTHLRFYACPRYLQGEKDLTKNSR